MSYILDDIARTIAKPMPRRDLIRFLSKTAGAGLLAMLGMDRAAAQICRGFRCGAQCCTFGQNCCSGGFAPPHCAAVGRTCCGDTDCARTEVCCDLACCSQGYYCINGRCSASALTASLSDFPPPWWTGWPF